MDEKRKQAAKKLLAAAREFWDACRAEGQAAAVQWVDDSSGALLIFTRGEYREALVKNVCDLHRKKVHVFDIETVEDDEGRVAVEGGE